MKHVPAMFSSALAIELLAQTLTSVFSLRVIIALICVSALVCWYHHQPSHHHPWFGDDDDWL